jgi:putative effector of murein hydrolase LrgA (UPF0299 family)
MDADTYQLLTDIVPHIKISVNILLNHMYALFIPIQISVNILLNHLYALFVQILIHLHQTPESTLRH